MWWALQTVTTVGYGDVVPESTAGRGVASLLLLGGLAFLTVIIAMITGNFVSRFQRQAIAAGEDPYLQASERLSRELQELRAELRAMRGDGAPPPRRRPAIRLAIAARGRARGGVPRGRGLAMFVLSTLVYPLALALLCLGAGLLVERAQRRLAPRRAAPERRRRRVDRRDPATHVRAGDRARHARVDRAARRRRPDPLARAAARPGVSARASARSAPSSPVARLCARRSRPCCSRAAPRSPRSWRCRLRRAHDGRRLPDPPRPELQPSRPRQLLRPVRQGLLRHRLPLRRRHAVRRRARCSCTCR